MKLLKIYISLLGLFVLNLGFSQTTIGLVAYYSFDNCDAVNEVSQVSNGVLIGGPDCDCGVEGMAMEFDGIDDHIVFTGLVNDVFKASNFSISFYFKPYTSSANQNLISKQENCNDGLALLNIDYVVNSSQTSTTLNKDAIEKVNLMANLSPNCWQHYTLTRKNKEISVYINGRLEAQTISNDVIDLDNNGALSISNSSCIGSSVTRFNGLLDELRIYNKALNIEEIQELYTNPYEIVNRDTTIFLGDYVDAFTSTTCPTNFNWTPSGSVSDPSSPNPTLTPEETTIYTVDFIDSRGCITTDQVQVTVIDPATLDCTKIFVPKAFTPNGDGVNDVYFISNPQAVHELLSFEIYDRWGNRVFVAADAFSTWDGYYKGKVINPGVFYYKINYKCKGYEYVDAGSVTLIR